MSLISPLMPVPYYGTLIVGGSIRVTGTVVSKEGRSQGGPCPLPTGVGSGGYAGDLTPQLFMWRGY